MPRDKTDPSCEPTRLARERSRRPPCVAAPRCRTWLPPRRTFFTFFATEPVSGRKRKWPALPPPLSSVDHSIAGEADPPLPAGDHASPADGGVRPTARVGGPSGPDRREDVGGFCGRRPAGGWERRPVAGWERCSVAGWERRPVAGWGAMLGGMTAPGALGAAEARGAEPDDPLFDSPQRSGPRTVAGRSVVAHAPVSGG